jgi:hypothetical protein
MYITVSFLYFLVSFYTEAQLWAERLGIPCNAQHVRKLPRQYVCSQHYSVWFHVCRKTTSGQNGSSKCTYIDLIPHSALHREEIYKITISWSLKNMLQNVHNLTKPRTYSNWVRHFLTFSHLSSPVITNRNQHFSERRHLLSPWLCKWKCFWWRTQKHQPSKFFPKVWSVAVSNKIASIGQSYKTESTEKEIVWQNLDQRECTLKT